MNPEKRGNRSTDYKVNKGQKTISVTVRGESWRGQIRGCARHKLF